MKHCAIMTVIFAFLLLGCTSFKGIKPIYPKVGNPNSPKAVDSLTPTFKWEPSKEPGVTYDFVIYEGIKEESFWKGTKRAMGRRVYYREGLTETEHTIREPLKPDTEYYWSVRTRNGDKVSEWSLYDYTLFLGTAYMHAGNAPFMFKTPKEQKAE
jgi:hypothetical protein